MKSELRALARPNIVNELPDGQALFARASANLSRFVLIQATAMAELVGLSWTPSPTAPSDYRTLRKAFLVSRLTGQPLAVSDEHSAETIYDGPDANYAFRFWHDVTHVRLECDFDLDGELTVSTAHLDVLRAAGWGPGTLEFELLHADTLGQTLCGVATGSFPDDQPCFARRCVVASLTDAIKAEIAGQLNGDASP